MLGGFEGGSGVGFGDDVVAGVGIDDAGVGVDLGGLKSMSCFQDGVPVGGVDGIGLDDGAEDGFT